MRIDLIFNRYWTPISRQEVDAAEKLAVHRVARTVIYLTTG